MGNKETPIVHPKLDIPIGSAIDSSKEIPGLPLQLFFILIYWYTGVINKYRNLIIQEFTAHTSIVMETFAVTKEKE